MANNAVTRIDTTSLNKKLMELSRVAANAMPQIFEKFVESTPIAAVRGGNAREHTTFHDRTIIANYPYAQVLEDGRGFRDGQMRGSDQAPHGMIEPTREYAHTLITQTIKTIGKK